MNGEPADDEHLPVAASIEEVAQLAQAQLAERERQGDARWWAAAAATVLAASDVVLSVVAYLSAAMLSGVVGNVAYDVVKGGMQKLAHRRIPPDATVTAKAAEALALFAVYQRCAERGVPGKRLKDLAVTATTCEPSGRWTVLLAGRRMRARVAIPSGDLDGRNLEVTLWFGR